MKMPMCFAFAYGSNLDQAQMSRRCPGASIVGTAILEDHQLVFRGFSARWGGSVATVRRCVGAHVHGLVYALTPADVERLDRFEGAPVVYQRVGRLVRCGNGRRRRVQTYVMTRRESKIVTRPGPVYAARIWIAYVRLGFDRAPLNRALEGAP